MRAVTVAILLGCGAVGEIDAGDNLARQVGMVRFNPCVENCDTDGRAAPGNIPGLGSLDPGQTPLVVKIGIARKINNSSDGVNL